MSVGSVYMRVYVRACLHACECVHVWTSLLMFVNSLFPGSLELTALIYFFPSTMNDFLFCCFAYNFSSIT
jgi:hypothetical protein